MRARRCCRRRCILSTACRRNSLPCRFPFFRSTLRLLSPKVCTQNCHCEGLLVFKFLARISIFRSAGDCPTRREIGRVQLLRPKGGSTPASTSRRGRPAAKVLDDAGHNLEHMIHLEINASPFHGNDPESRDSNPAGLGPWFPRSPKARDVGQPSSVIRSALQDLDPPVPLQTLIFAIYYRKLAQKAAHCPSLYRTILGVEWLREARPNLSRQGLSPTS